MWAFPYFALAADALYRAEPRRASAGIPWPRDTVEERENSRVHPASRWTAIADPMLPGRINVGLSFQVDEYLAKRIRQGQLDSDDVGATSEEVDK